MIQCNSMTDFAQYVFNKLGIVSISTLEEKEAYWAKINNQLEKQILDNESLVKKELEFYKNKYPIVGPNINVQNYINHNVILLKPIVKFNYDEKNSYNSDIMFRADIDPLSLRMVVRLDYINKKEANYIIDMAIESFVKEFSSKLKSELIKSVKEVVDDDNRTIQLAF